MKQNKVILKKINIRGINCWIILFLIVISSIVAYFHLTLRVKTIGKDYRFEHEWLVNAISVACGQGFTTPVAPYPENMRLFLEQKTDAMNKTDLPKDWKRWDNSPFVKTHRYLITSIGFFWRLFGIRWSVLKIYAGVLFVITVLASYWTIYKLAGKLYAFFVSVMVVNAPALLFLLPSLRDYSKATFFMLFLAVLAELLYGTQKNTFKLLLFSSLLGLVIGFGIGFRQDMLILFLPGFIAVIAIAIYRFYKEHKFVVLTSIILYSIAFFISGLPILTAVAQEKGAVSSHSIVQGLSTTVENTVLGGESSYRLVYEPNDMLVHSTVVSHARRLGYDEPFDMYLSPAYGEAGRLYFKSVLWYFPADLWGRTLSSCGNCFTTLYCFVKVQKQNYPEFNIGSYMFTISDYLYLWDKLIAYIGPWTLLGIIFIAGYKNIWRGILTALFLGYLLSYPSLLFEYRHIVHLTPVLYAIVILTLLDIFKIPFLLLINRDKNINQKGDIAKGIKNGIITVLLVVISCSALYGMLLLWQNTQTRELFCSYHKLNWEKIDTTVIDNGTLSTFTPDNPLPAFEKAPHLPPMETPFEFLRADFALDKPIPINSRYEHTYPAIDFSEPFEPLMHQCIVDTKSINRISIFFPVYPASTIKPRNELIFNNQEPIEWVRSHWLGIEIPKQYIKTFQGLFRSENTESVPLLTTVVTTNNCEVAQKYKRWTIPWNPFNVHKNIKKLGRYGIQD